MHKMLCEIDLEKAQGYPGRYLEHFSTTNRAPAYAECRELVAKPGLRVATEQSFQKSQRSGRIFGNEAYRRFRSEYRCINTHRICFQGIFGLSICNVSRLYPIVASGNERGPRILKTRGIEDEIYTMDWALPRDPSGRSLHLVRHLRAGNSSPERYTFSEKEDGYAV